jgi:hypothetical protein
MNKILRTQSFHKWVIGSTIVIFFVLTTIATPFVFNGFFMSSFWDVFTDVLLLSIVFELNVLGI